MKHWTALIVIALLSLGAIYWAEHKKVDVQASPEAMMYFIADSERELTRLPIAMTKLSDEEEIRIGDEMAAHYAQWRRPGQETPEERETREYIEQVGGRVAGHANRKLPYKFHYISEPYFVNAFALPGGHVFIGQGLINLMDSEDELANVLGHEVEHVDLNHCVERVQIEARMRHLNLGIVGALANIPIQVFEAGYSKEQELAADREGTKLAVSARYSPEGAVRMFETFEKFEPGHRRKPGSPEEEITTVSLSSLTEYFRSHPPSAMRAEQIRRLIADENWPVVKETDLKIAYLRFKALAEAAFEQRKYKEAVEYAKRSRELHPRQSDLVRLMGRSQFMLGDFIASAESYRTLLVEYPSMGPEDQRAFADALAATHSNTAATQFSDFAQHFTPRSEWMALSVRVDEAGLFLMAGNSRPSEGLDRELIALDKPFTGDLVARLAWWYYRAGRPERSTQLCEQAIQLRPQEGRFRVQRAWPEIDLRHYDSALAGLGSYGGDAEMHAIRAVGQWLAENHESALSEYGSISSDPAWSNRHWVEGNYSPTVVSALEEMRQERDRRIAAQKR